MELTKLGRTKASLLISGICVCLISVTFALPPLQSTSDFGNSPESLSSVDANFEIPTPRYRLPRQVTPKHYILRQRPILTPDAIDRFSAPSQVTITIHCEESTNEIILHRFKDTIQISTLNVKVTKISDQTVQVIKTQTFDDEKDFYKIELEIPLEVGETYDIFIPFLAEVKVSETLTDLVGLYASYYMDPADPTTKRYLSTTKFEPFHARKAFPCFDEPDLKATFKITLGRHKDYHSLSNMKDKITSAIPDYTDWFWDEYDTTAVEMSTYLVCMIVSDFKAVTVQGGSFGKPVSTWAPAHIIASHGGSYSAAAVDKILFYLENKLKIPYALDKMDSISIPQFPSGAMENWGLNTYRDSLLIYYPDMSTESERGRIDNVISHEITHQWFGNWVTCKWWSDIWLNEGFATYLSFIGVEHTSPEFDPLKRFITDGVQLAMRFDQGPLTHPVKNTALLPAEIVKVFSRISYEKAAALIRMMEGFLTEEFLWNGLIAYLQEYALKVAEQDDLFKSLNEAAKTVLPTGLTVKDIMDTWTLKSGYPLVRVTAAGARRVYISQEKFELKPSGTQPSEYWHIPLTVVTAENPDFANKFPDLWIRKNEFLVNYGVPDTISKWVILNSDGIGYYRVHYDRQLLNLINDQLMKDHTVISPASRSQLLDDYFNFAFLGSYENPITTLELTRYMLKEKELVVWNAVLTNLREPVNKLTGTPGFIAVQHYLTPRVELALKTVQDADLGADVILRTQLMDWACSLGSADCLVQSEQLLDEWMTDPDNLKILSDIQSVVFCSGVARKGDPGLTFLYSKYKSADTHDIIKLRLLNALGCVEDATLLSSLLNDAVDPNSEIRVADRVTLLQRIVANTHGRDLAYEFITTKLAETGPIRFAAVVSSLSIYWHTEENLNKLQTFIEENESELDPVRDTLNISLENIRNNIVWIENIGKPMVAWMIGNN